MNAELHDLLVTELRLTPDAVRDEARIEDAGLDSLTLVELSQLLGEKWDVQVGEDALAANATLGELDRMVADRRARR